MSASLALPPAKVSPVSVLIQTQFRTKPRPPPAGTSFAGQTALVTGSSSGLCEATCKHLLTLGLSRLIMGVCDGTKGERVASSLRARFPNARVDVWTVDQASYASGHESMLQVDYLSTALLAFLLLPVLKAETSNHPGRLTIVGSNLALTDPFPPTDKDPLIPWLDDASAHAPGWSLMAANQRQILAKIFLLMLVQHLGALVDPAHVIVNVVDPGMVKGTEVGRRLPAPAKAFVHVVFGLVARTPEQGAWHYLDAAAVKGAESHGGFVVNWAVHPFHPGMFTTEGRALTDRVWAETLQELAFADVKTALDSVRRVA